MLFETPPGAGAAAGALVSLPRVEQTPVSHAFFSRANVEALHTTIRYQVYLRTGSVIDRQGDNQLRTIMAAVYENSMAPTPESALSGGTTRIVGSLNARVASRAVNEIIGAMSMHRFYMNDVSSPVPVPVERFRFADDRTGTKTRQLPVGF